MEKPVGVHTFKSPDTGEFVQAHQYIAELIVKRKAKKENVILPYKYWSEEGYEKWAKEYKGQVAQAGKLLRQYDARAIVKALESLFWCFSLRTPKLIEKIKEEQIKLDQQMKDSQIETVDTTYQERPTFNNKLGKLRGR